MSVEDIRALTRIQGMLKHLGSNITNVSSFKTKYPEIFDQLRKIDPSDINDVNEAKSKKRGTKPAKKKPIATDETTDFHVFFQERILTKYVCL